jgi:hypothetical protein
MNTEALIIFIRNPVPGKVKTRLAKTLGEEKALCIYRHLLDHTHRVTQHLACDKFVFYADALEENDLWEEDLYYKKLQSGEDLGRRMKNAFSCLFLSGYHKLLIIGSDCLELTTAIIECGFLQLDKQDIVIGPCPDGGYYLLGMKKDTPAFFEGKTWSTPSVLADTLADCRKCSLTYSLLPELNDIDEEKDIPESLLTKCAVCDKTAANLGALKRGDILLSPSSWFYDGGGCC